MAKNWREVRAQAIKQGNVSEAGIQKAAAVNRAAERSYRLAEVRKRAGVVQKEMADSIGVSQAAISKLEHGDLAHTQVATLGAYIAAMGGRLEVNAVFDDETLKLA